MGQIDLKQTLAKSSMHGEKAQWGELRNRMFGRPGCNLCDDPRGIAKWAADNRVSAYADVIAKAFWDWRTLDAEARLCLAGRRLAAAEWDESRASRRRTVLRECSAADLAAIAPNAPFPRDQAAFDAQLAAFKRVATLAFPHEFEAASRRLGAAEQLLRARERAKRSADAGFLPAQAVLAAADAGSPEAAAAALKDYYDGVSHTRPLDEEELAELKEEEKRWRVLAESLGPALIDATRGSRAGDEIAAFYAKTPLRLEIRKTEGAYATFDSRNDVITLDRGLVETLLKANYERNTPAEAVANPAILRRLAVGLSAVFAHEVSHHRYAVWQRENKAVARSSVENESEAMEVEALFLLEKFARDPAFAREYRAATGLDSIVISDDNVGEQTLGAARAFSRDPESFRRHIRTSMYGYRPAYEGVAADSYQFYRAAAESYDAELRHRAGQTAERQAVLASLPRAALKIDKDAWPRDGELPTIPTAQLRELAARARRRAGEIEAVYAANSTRSREVFAKNEEWLKLVKTGGLPARPGKSEPPPPGGPI